MQGNCNCLCPPVSKPRAHRYILCGVEMEKGPTHIWLVWGSFVEIQNKSRRHKYYLSVISDSFICIKIHVL